MGCGSDKNFRASGLEPDRPRSSSRKITAQQRVDLHSLACVARIYRCWNYELTFPSEVLWDRKDSHIVVSYRVDCEILHVSMRLCALSTGTVAARSGTGTAGPKGRGCRSSRRCSAPARCPRRKEIIAFPVYDCLVDFALTNMASLPGSSISGHISHNCWAYFKIPSVWEFLAKPAAVRKEIPVKLLCCRCACVPDEFPGGFRVTVLWFHSQRANRS